MLLTDEISRRDSTAATRRAEQAGLDPDMVIERWDKTAKVSFDRRVLGELASLRFVEDHRNVVILGPVGVGKTFLASALGRVLQGLLPIHGGEIEDAAGGTSNCWESSSVCDRHVTPKKSRERPQLALSPCAPLYCRRREPP